MSVGRPGVGLEPQAAPNAAAPNAAAPSAAAVLAWAGARDRALRGLVHALSNRAGTVGALGAMLAGAPASVATAAEVLAGEGERLERLLALLRLATADPFGPDAAPEPVHVPELLAEVAALAEHARPDPAPRAAVAPGVPPALAGRTALAHALLVLAVDAPGDLVAEAAPGGGAVLIRAAAGSLGADAAAAAAWLLAPSGGSAAPADGGVLVRVPALGAPR